MKNPILYVIHPARCRRRFAKFPRMSQQKFHVCETENGFVCTASFRAQQKMMSLSSAESGQVSFLSCSVNPLSFWRTSRSLFTYLKCFVMSVEATVCSTSCLKRRKSAISKLRNTSWPSSSIILNACNRAKMVQGV